MPITMSCARPGYHPGTTRLLRGQHMLLGLALALSACGHPGAQDDPNHGRLGPHFEARLWISANANRHCLASNRFPTSADALAFVDSLYAAGAETVWALEIIADTATLSWEGGPYAEGMLALLPGDPELRSRIFAIAAAEARAQGLDPEIDIGQQRLFFWWD